MNNPAAGLPVEYGSLQKKARQWPQQQFNGCSMCVGLTSSSSQHFQLRDRPFVARCPAHLSIPFAHGLEAANSRLSTALSIAMRMEACKVEHDPAQLLEM